MLSIVDFLAAYVCLLLVDKAQSFCGWRLTRHVADISYYARSREVRTCASTSVRRVVQGVSMKFRLVHETGGSRPRVAVWDQQEWVPLNQALMRARNGASDGQLEEAAMGESVLPFLESQELRDSVSNLLVRVRSRRGAWDVNLSRAPVLPFQPQGFRDCSVYMGHMSGASAATIKQNPTYFVQALFMGLGRMLRLPCPRFSINHAFWEVPVHYHGNHMTFMTEGEEASWPCYTRKLDYELEVAIVVAKTIKNATLEEALKAIGGFVVINDFSARDVQLYEMAETGFGFPKSKNFGTACGVEVVTADEILPRIFSEEGLKAEVVVNGETWSTGNTNDRTRVHGVAEVLAYASLGETIYRGEVLGLGTLPKCCGLEVNRWIKPGDEVTVRVEGIGAVTNTIGRPELYPADWAKAQPSCFKHLSYRRLARSEQNSAKRALSLLHVVCVGLAAWLAWRIKTVPFEPNVWRRQSPLVALEGPALGVNRNITGAEHMFAGDVVGPESIAEGSNGEVYLSLNDGRVVRLDPTLSTLTTVFFTGGVITEERERGSEKAKLSNGVEQTGVMQWCSSGVLAGRLSLGTEEKCGRPLGMRYVKRSKLLYIADAYHGIFALNVDTLAVSHLVSPEAPTQARYTVAAPGEASIWQLPIRFFNDLDVTPNGDIYFTDTSWKYTRVQHPLEIMDGTPRGRLFRYDSKTSTVEPVMCGLHFANGVQLLNGKLLVCESTRFRIVEVDLQAWQSLSQDDKNAALQNCDEDALLPSFARFFSESLPGLPDNLRVQESATPDGKDVIYLGMGLKNTQPFSLLPFLYRGVVARYLLGALVPLKYFSLFLPKYGLLATLSQDGKIVRLRQDPTGRTPFISEGHYHASTGSLLLGSFKNRFLARVTLRNRPK